MFSGINRTLTILCALMTLLSYGIAENKHIRILQSDARGLVVEFVPSYTPVSTLYKEGVQFTTYDFEGSIMAENQLPGSPEIRITSMVLRFPAEGRNTVEILNADYEDVPNVLLPPVPHMHEGEIDPLYTYSIDQNAYGKSGFMPNNIAMLTHIGTTRGAVLGNLIISPVQYNPGSRIVRKYSRIVVRVNFGISGGQTKRHDVLVDGIALNDKTFSTGEAPVSVNRQTVIHNSVLSTGAWFRFPVTESGMYKITGQFLLDAGIPSSVDPHTIKIYGNGGYETPMDVNASYTDDLIENALFVNDGGTSGQLDPADYILFYGKGTRGWKYTSGTKTFSHYINHFTETNFYWLCYGNGSNKMMTQAPSLTQPSPFEPATIVGKLFREDERINILSSGQEWVGQPFNAGEQFFYVHPLDGLDASQPVTYTFRVGARSPGFSTFALDEHAQRITSVGLSGTDIGDYFSSQFINTVNSRQQVPSFSDGISRLKFSFNSSSSSGSGYIDWYEIFYKRFLAAQNNELSFHSHDTTAVVQYDVTGFSTSQIFVFDVSRYDSVVLITAPRISADSCLFQVPLTAGKVKEFYVIGGNAFKTPAQLTRAGNQNLHGETMPASYIIIAHPDFMQAAQRLKNYRELPGDNYLQTLVVDVNEIYNEFGGGLLSPVAIRNYLRYVTTNWTVPPKYVLLFGDGDYDYKRISGPGTNWIPPWETFESFYPLYSYAGEDEYVTFDAGRRVGLGLGRLAARSLAEANIMVDKIIEYESAPVNDPWKIRVTLVADDGLAGVRSDGKTQNDLFLHTGQAEALAAIVPPLFEKRKIFLYDYPTVYTPAGRRKPEVTTAIENQINQGTLILNFTGHGNPQVWAHEQVFVLTDFSALANKGKYFFLVAATCNYSHVDMVGVQSGGEQLMVLQNGGQNTGAIGVLSATRPVFAGDNFSLNQTVYQKLFQTDGSGNLLQKRIGDVIYKTKQENFGGTADNDRKFFLLGDPALRIAFPGKVATIDSVNGITSAQVGQLRALSPVSVKATVHDSLSAGRIDFNGKAQLVVFDANKQSLLKDSIEIAANVFAKASLSYTVAGNTLFRGEQSVTNGVVNANFIVPKDISYGNDFGRMTLYVSNAGNDGAGYTTNFRVGGTDSAALADTRGPQLNLFIDNRSFRSGDVVSASPTLIADLFDSNGINTSGAGIGHRLEAWLDDNSQSIDVSDFYKSKTDTYREGTVQYSLGALAQGTHKLRLRAWDTYNNSSTGETVFDVVSSVGLRLSNVFNFPNPVRTNTVFTFQQNQLVPIDAEVKIYTVAGRLIQSLKRTNINDSFIQIPWDGRDKEGDALANGVYLYKIIARTQDSRFTSEALGKLSITK